MNEETFVHKAISEPDIDMIKLCDVFEVSKPHLFPNFTNRGLTVPLPWAHVALGEGPLTIGIDHHRKLNTLFCTPKNKASGRDFVFMALLLTFTAS